ncbi:hypothetical protein LC55x_2614 [Lysobacter capsici]|uniref:hypothetical protein n=1 Tax=Lysobacter capsici TaxID=435897 RepID=UPI000716664B|nr:hypothetical protein [Lysobacter capsici]ALN85879.1 hypothetical protein LC55x_2614 [Lysobacter capsici]
MLSLIARLLLLGGVALLAAGFYYDGERPAPGALSPSVLHDPLQTPTALPAFPAQAGGVDYEITPVAEYDISGLIVSWHDSETWWDREHEQSRDYLNVADLCMVWGANAADGAYEVMDFSNGQWVCYISYTDVDRVGPAHVRAISNNHILTDNEDVARQIRGLKVGDQVRLRGQLASYSHHSGFDFQRGTSTHRDDQGNGACETLFVREVQLLQAAPVWPRNLRWFGALLLLAGLIGWYRAPFGERQR